MRRIRAILAVVAVLAVCLGTVPSANAVGGNATQWRMDEVRFQTRSARSFIYLHMFRMEARSAAYEAPLSGGAHAHEPFVFVYGCLAFQINYVADYACGVQKASAFTMEVDLSTARMSFVGRSTTFAIPVSAKFSTVGQTSERNEPRYSATPPVPGALSLEVEARAKRSRYGVSTGRAKLGRFGSIGVSRLYSHMSSEAWISTQASA